MTISYTIKPTTEGWVPARLVKDVADMIGKAVEEASKREDEYCGPFAVIFSKGWRKYLNVPYLPTNPHMAKKTVRQRLEEMTLICGVGISNTLRGYEMRLFQQVCIGDDTGDTE
jgi:hypothetical protein